MIAGRFSHQQARGLVLVTLMGLISGCAAVQSNVRGGFACGAPGGTCAPSTTIDDGALTAMHRAERVQGSGRDKVEGADLVLGDEAMPDDGAIIVKARQPVGRQAATDRSTAPVGRALKIVYPAYQDGDGRAHPRQLAYALVDTSAWASALKGRGNLSASANQPRSGEGLLGAALSAPPLGGLGRETPGDTLTASTPVAAAQGQGAATMLAAPDAQAVGPVGVGMAGVGMAGVGTGGSAPSAGKSTSPTAQIEAEVSALLARRKAASGAGTFSGKVE